MTDEERLHKILTLLQDANFRYLTIEFREVFAGTPRRLELKKDSLHDIQLAAGLLVISYNPKESTRNDEINTEIVHMSDVRAIFFDSIPSRSQQPF
jgi:hypothetical protein